ncbi:MAG TPA: hypothetical protein VK000_01470 [Luteimonas sp.]|nr:hypothetical protein [Luteimonas sp.]
MSHDTRDIPLAPLPQQAWVFLVALAAALVLAGLLLPAGRTVPAPAWPMIPFGLALLLVPLALALRRRRLTIDGDELVVAATFYTRRVPVRTLELERARIVDLAEHTEFKPWLGGNRIDLPGFQAGYYLLRNRQRAFCLITARERVLVLPLRDGKLLMISPRQPRDLLARLERIASLAARG